MPGDESIRPATPAPVLTPVTPLIPQPSQQIATAAPPTAGAGIGQGIHNMVNGGQAFSGLRQLFHGGAPAQQGPQNAQGQPSGGGLINMVKNAFSGPTPGATAGGANAGGLGPQAIAPPVPVQGSGLASIGSGGAAAGGDVAAAGGADAAAAGADAGIADAGVGLLI